MFNKEIKFNSFSIIAYVKKTKAQRIVPKHIRRAFMPEFISPLGR
jgi:hypothetical protein